MGRGLHRADRLGKPVINTAFSAPNPPFGATFTYFIGDEPKTAEATRREAEDALRDEGADVPFPGWQRLADEALEVDPKVVLTVRDAWWYVPYATNQK